MDFFSNIFGNRNVQPMYPENFDGKKAKQVLSSIRDKIMENNIREKKNTISLPDDRNIEVEYVANRENGLPCLIQKFTVTYQLEENEDNQILWVPESEDKVVQCLDCDELYDHLVEIGVIRLFIKNGEDEVVLWQAVNYEEIDKLLSEAETLFKDVKFPHFH